MLSEPDGLRPNSPNLLGIGIPRSRQWLARQIFSPSIASVFDNSALRMARLGWVEGRVSGAFVNYQRLSDAERWRRKTLEKLIHTVLGDWISRQREGVRAGHDGADARLTAAVAFHNLNLRKFFDRRSLLSTSLSDGSPSTSNLSDGSRIVNDGIRVNIRPWLTDEPAAVIENGPMPASCVATPNMSSTAKTEAKSRHATRRISRGSPSSDGSEQRHPPQPRRKTRRRESGGRSETAGTTAGLAREVR